ncbi:hypothetical protein AX769_06240 [Frondihabitans sp. PAMC 28766]|uniref:WXG100 family type VII secretion target n=1 Tax=Frondihabitans sp. PAMC 28766 TaxID=1795630 RepID=UPI00078BC4FD|nr:WXG100 family type VII secretion target [Frondihabitans sp. PAMC 28766]AMM19826.1 hypothetical protein AX769_06240 [Frondihabitans sp. PAMC 28766]
MNGSHEVDLDYLNESARTFDETATYCEELRAKIGALAARLGGTWSGQAEAQFAELQQQWAAGAAEMAEGMALITQTARIAHENYSRTKTPTCGCGGDPVTTVKVTPSAYAGVAHTFNGAISSLTSHAESALGSLAASAGMAGSDPVGSRWAAAYDPVAASVFRALTAASSTMASISHGIDVTGQNHANSDSASAGKGLAAWAGFSTPHPVAFSSPPSSAGGSSSPPTGWDLVKDAVGVAWPSGDTGKLRATAAAWGRLADGIEGVHSAHLRDSTAPIDSFMSAEIPHIQTTVHTTSAQLTSVASQARGLQSATSGYADQIDAVRASSVITLVALGAAVTATTGAGVALTLFTFGGSDAGAALADAAEVAAAAAKIAAQIAIVAAFVGMAESTLEDLHVQISSASAILEGIRIAKYVVSTISPPNKKAKPYYPQGPRDGEQNRPIPLPGPLPLPDGKTLTQKQPKKNERTLVLMIKPGWDESQVKQAALKTAELNAIAVSGEDGGLRRTRVRRGKVKNLRKRFLQEHPGTDLAGKDVDHIHELQLGGEDDVANMQPLDKSVNRSIGAQIQQQIAKDERGTQYKRVVLIQPPMGVSVPEAQDNWPQ